MQKLSPKQQWFVEEYCLGKTATEAARIAGYSAKRPDVSGAKLLKNRAVAAAIKARQQRTASKFEVTQDRIISELAAVAFSDARQLYDEHGYLKPVQQLDAATAAALAGVETEEIQSGRGKKRTTIATTRKIRRWDKVKAIELLGKHFGMFAERLKFDAPPGSHVQAVVNVRIGS